MREKKKKRNRGEKEKNTTKTEQLILITFALNRYMISHHSIPIILATISPILYVRKLRFEETKSCPRS